MPLPFTAARPDRAVLESLTAHLGRRPSVLAWARTADGAVVGLAGAMYVHAATGWSVQPWHEVDHGNWDEATGLLSWSDAAGVPHSLALSDARRFADLFNERVSASVVASRRVPLGKGRYAMVALRRDLGSSTGETSWSVTPGRGVDPADPATRIMLAEALLEAQADFGIS